MAFYRPGYFYTRSRLQILTSRNNCYLGVSSLTWRYLLNQYDPHLFGTREFTKQPEGGTGEVNKIDKKVTKLKDDTLDPQALQGVLRNLRIYKGHPAVEDDWTGEEDPSVGKTRIIDEEYKLELETSIVEAKKQEKEELIGDFVSPETNLFDKSVQWEAFPMEAMYTLLQHADKASSMGIVKWAKQYEEPIESWLAKHSPEYDEKDEVETSEYKDITVTGEEAFIASSIQTKPGGKYIDGLDCAPYDNSPDNHVLPFDRQMRLQPPDDELFEDFMAGLGPDYEKYYPKNVALEKQKYKEKKEFEQQLIEENRGGKWRELQRKEGKIWSNFHDNPKLFPVHDPDYTYDDWELEVKALHEREFIAEDHPFVKNLRQHDDPEDPDHLRFDYSQTVLPNMTESELLKWQEFDEFDPLAHNKIWNTAGYDQDSFDVSKLDPSWEEPDSDTMGRVEAQSYMPPIHRDGYNFDDWNFERMKDDNQDIDPKYEHSNKREGEFLDALGLGHEENEEGKEVATKKPKQWNRPLPFLTDESKWAIYWLHQEDPVKYTPRELAKKFHIQLGRAEGIIKLQHLERMYIESGFVIGDMDGLDDGDEENIEMEFEPTDAVWDPDTPPAFEHMPAIQLLDDDDRMMAELLDKKALHAYHKIEEDKDRREKKMYGKFGPIGSMRPPAPEPITLDVSRFNKKNQYTKKNRFPIVLTNISKQKKNQYRIAVRDTDSTLRAPSHGEFWNVRVRER